MNTITENVQIHTYVLGWEWTTSFTEADGNDDDDDDDVPAAADDDDDDDDSDDDDAMTHWHVVLRSLTPSPSLIRLKESTRVCGSMAV